MLPRSNRPFSGTGLMPLRGWSVSSPGFPRLTPWATVSSPLRGWPVGASSPNRPMARAMGDRLVAPPGLAGVGASSTNRPMAGAMGYRLVAPPGLVGVGASSTNRPMAGAMGYRLVAPPGLVGVGGASRISPIPRHAVGYRLAPLPGLVGVGASSLPRADALDVLAAPPGLKMRPAAPEGRQRL